MYSFIFRAYFLFLAGFLVSTSNANTQCNTNDPSNSGIVPSLYIGNPALCPGGVKVDPGVSGVYPLDAMGNNVTVMVTTTSCGQVFSWSVPSNVIIEYVYAKGGPDANVYDYTGQNPVPTSDGGLHAPDVSSDKYADLSHIDFCFSYQLSLSKTAVTNYSRTYDWCFEKECKGASSLLLSTGQVFDYPFALTAEACGSTDSDWKVKGSITIFNNTPFSATITGITDLMTGNILGILDLGVGLPYALPSGQTLIVPYAADLTGAIDGENTATVTTSTPKVKGGTAKAPYAFGTPTTELDACITITDDCAAPVKVCRDVSPYTLNYTCAIGPFEECGEYLFTNNAKYLTSDNEIVGSDNCSVAQTVACLPEGCTLTQGYWKTHSSYGPAPYDDTWALLGENTVFFLSGKTYYQVLWTPPAGNAYYILAHQYIAAVLNALDGANVPTDVQTAINSATTLFNANTPAQIAALKGAAKQNVANLATILGNYNTGLVGPGHCSESSSISALAAIPAYGIPSDLMDGVTVQAVVLSGQELRIAFSTTYNTPVTVQLFDLSGRTMATLYNASVVAAQDEIIRYDVSGLPGGIYVYSLRTDRELKSGQIVAIK